MDIEIERLSKRYGKVEVFTDFSATFRRNSISVVMGKSGTGKTTLLNCVAGLIPYDGVIRGVDGVSYVFQEDRLIPFASVYENLDLTLDSSVNGKERALKIFDTLSLLGIKDKAVSMPRELSGGQRKRVSIARAFLSDKSVLLMDEPLNSLDLGLKIKMRDLLVELLKKYPKTVLYVTHDIDEALSVADDIVVIGKSGVEYSYAFVDKVENRDLLGEECIGVKSKLINLLCEE